MSPKRNVDGAMHFIYSHKYISNSAEDSSDMNCTHIIILYKLSWPDTNTDGTSVSPTR